MPIIWLPGIDEIGVMLPYTPLHHLLFPQDDCPEVLVMTSGNISGTPICTANEDALVRLGPLADLFFSITVRLSPGSMTRW